MFQDSVTMLMVLAFAHLCPAAIPPFAASLLYIVALDITIGINGSVAHFQLPTTNWKQKLWSKDVS